MASPLSDLDELVLKCRDEKAKSYIKEAVSCYKAGAFRSSIVSTWIAVSFDIIDKLKELSLAGDKEAEQQIETFEKARRLGDITNSLKFERDILAVCRDKLEFISPVEYIDLQRLQEDRNRCAHPSMTIDGEIFHPSAELARMHIRSAVESLLQFPPAQGKYALDTLLSEVKSDYFPSDIDKAVLIFENGPLKKARASLIRNFTITLFKRALNEQIDFKGSLKNSSAINAIKIIHRENFEETLQTKLSNIIRSLDIKYLHRVIPFLVEIKDVWMFLDLDVQQKIELYIENLPSEHINDLEDIFNINQLVTSAEKRLHKISKTELAELIFWDAPTQICEKIIDVYGKSKSFDQANNFAPTVVRNSPSFDRAQIKKVINLSAENEQIKHSFEISTVINALRKNNKVTDVDIDSWLKEVELFKFVKIKDEEL